MSDDNETSSMTAIGDRHEKPLSDTQKYWRVMSFYERFEHAIALVLSAVISVIVLIALWRLAREVFTLLVRDALDPLDHKIFQAVFGMIMTLLIAMEFKHSILKVLERQAHIIQVKTVILIAQLALARKFIILDLAATDAGKLAALGFAFLVLGAVHWLLQERDDQSTRYAASLTDAKQKPTKTLLSGRESN